MIVIIVDVSMMPLMIRLLRWLSGRESACQHRRRRRHGFDHWVGEIPWRRKWQPTPVLLPGESHGQRSLVGCGPRGHRVDLAERAYTLMVTRGGEECVSSMSGTWG